MDPLLWECGILATGPPGKSLERTSFRIRGVGTDNSRVVCYTQVQRQQRSKRHGRVSEAGCPLVLIGITENWAGSSPRLQKETSLANGGCQAWTWRLQAETHGYTWSGVGYEIHGASLTSQQHSRLGRPWVCLSVRHSLA